MPDPPEIFLFTDGACSGNPGPGGWAAILKQSGTGKTLKMSGADAETTNNRMELLAAIKGLQAIKPVKRWRVRLISDSEYVIHGLTLWMDNWLANGWRRGKKANADPVKNVDLWKTLYALSRQFDMSYEHVRGHSGHPENEECDQLAVAEIKAMAKE